MKLQTAKSILDDLINDDRMSDAEGIAAAMGAEAITLIAAHRASISYFVTTYKGKRATTTRLRLRTTDRFRRGDTVPVKGSIAFALYESFPNIQARSLMQIRPRFLAKPEVKVSDFYTKKYPNYHRASYAYTRGYILGGIRKGYLKLVRE